MVALNIDLSSEPCPLNMFTNCYKIESCCPVQRIVLSIFSYELRSA